MATAARTSTAGYGGDVRTTSTWAIAEGVVLIILGLIAVFARYATVPRLVLAIALYLVVTGILEVIAAFRAEGEGGSTWDLVFGIVAILAAVLVFGGTTFGAISVHAIVAGYFLVQALARFVIGYMDRSESTGWTWVVAMGVLDLILGIYVLAVPGLALITLAVLVGIEILGTGVVMTVIGALERTHRLRAGATPAA